MFGKETVAGFGVDVCAGLEQVHHEETERDPGGHVQAEQEEGAGGERAESIQALELNDAEGERRKDERDNDEKQETEKDLAERFKGFATDPADRGFGRGCNEEQRAGAEAEQEAGDEAPKDATREGIGWSRPIVHDGGIKVWAEEVYGRGDEEPWSGRDGRRGSGYLSRLWKRAATGR